MHVNRRNDNVSDHPPPRSRNRHLDRPRDLKAMQLISTYPDRNVQIVNNTMMIPLPPEDARALGLRVPETENSSIGSRSTSSRNSAGPSRTTRNCSNENLERHQTTVDAKPVNKLLKEKRKTQRNLVSGKLSNIHARLERALKSIPGRTKTGRKVGSKTAKTTVP